MDFHVKFHFSKEKSDLILNLLFKFCEFKFTNVDFYVSFFMSLVCYFKEYLLCKNRRYMITLEFWCLMVVGGGVLA